MKICIVGNSHIGALKLALTKGMVELPSLQIDFWGGAGPLYHKVFVDGGRLKAPADVEQKFLSVSGGKHLSVDPNGFDLVVFHGASLDTFRPIFAISKRFERNPQITQAAIDVVVREWLNAKLTFQLAMDLRRGSSTQIAFSPMPSPSESMRLQPENAKDASQEIYKRVLASFKSFVEQNGIDLICQPENTLSTFPNYTKLEYATDSAQLYDASMHHRADDVLHMNEKYGVEVLKAIEQYVASKSWV